MIDFIWFVVCCSVIKTAILTSPVLVYWYELKRREYASLRIDASGAIHYSVCDQDIASPNDAARPFQSGYRINKYLDLGL